ncbi:putative transposase [Escherichia coli]|nr:putative transposase [Escherichia coli]
MKSLTAVRKKSPNYPVEFKIKMVELSHRPEISVAQLAREHGINDNLLFKWPVLARRKTTSSFNNRKQRA